MGGSSLWVKNGQLSLKKLSYVTPGVSASTLDDFVYEDSLKNELDRDLSETIENLIIDFPKPAHNLRRTPLDFEKDMCSLYDSAHDFGEWKINYDILSRNSASLCLNSFTVPCDITAPSIKEANLISWSRNV